MRELSERKIIKVLLKKERVGFGNRKQIKAIEVEKNPFEKNYFLSIIISFSHCVGTLRKNG